MASSWPVTRSQAMEAYHGSSAEMLRQLPGASRSSSSSSSSSSAAPASASASASASRLPASSTSSSVAPYHQSYSTYPHISQQHQLTAYVPLSPPAYYGEEDGLPSAGFGYAPSPMTSARIQAKREAEEKFASRPLARQNSISEGQYAHAPHEPTPPDSGRSKALWLAQRLAEERQQGIDSPYNPPQQLEEYGDSVPWPRRSQIPDADLAVGLLPETLGRSHNTSHSRSRSRSRSRSPSRSHSQSRTAPAAPAHGRGVHDPELEYRYWNSDTLEYESIDEDEDLWALRCPPEGAIEDESYRGAVTRARSGHIVPARPLSIDSDSRSRNTRSLSADSALGASICSDSRRVRQSGIVFNKHPIRDTPNNPFLEGDGVAVGKAGGLFHSSRMSRGEEAARAHRRGYLTYVFRGQRILHPDVASDDDSEEELDEYVHPRGGAPRRTTGSRLQPKLLFPEAHAQERQRKARQAAAASSSKGPMTMGELRDLQSSLRERSTTRRPSSHFQSQQQRPQQQQQQYNTRQRASQQHDLGPPFDPVDLHGRPESRGHGESRAQAQSYRDDSFGPLSDRDRRMQERQLRSEQQQQQQQQQRFQPQESLNSSKRARTAYEGEDAASVVPAVAQCDEFGRPLLQAEADLRDSKRRRFLEAKAFYSSTVPERLAQDDVYKPSGRHSSMVATRTDRVESLPKGPLSESHLPSPSSRMKEHQQYQQRKQPHVVLPLPSDPHRHLAESSSCNVGILAQLERAGWASDDDDNDDEEEEVGEDEPVTKSVYHGDNSLYGCSYGAASTVDGTARHGNGNGNSQIHAGSSSSSSSSSTWEAVARAGGYY